MLFLSELRYAIRHLRRSPGFCLAAVLTAGLSLGANAAMFSLQNALIFRELPIPDPSSLIAISGRSSQDQLRLTPIGAVDQLSRDIGALRAVCGYNSGVVLAVGAGDATSQAIGALVTGACFETFGVAPLLGRTIVADDAPLDRPGKMVAVISHRLWMRLFGGERSATGRTIRVEGAQLVVIGVMPKGFDGLDIDAGVDIYAPYDTIFPARPDRRPGAGQILARLSPDASFDGVASQVAASWPALLDAIVPASVPAAERSSLLAARPRVERMATGLSGHRTRYGRAVTVMSGLAGILLVLACLNLGGLLLARAIDRAPEIAMRLALGSSRWQVTRQSLIENALVAAAGAFLAIPLAFVVVDAVASFLPAGNIARTLSLTPDRFVIGLTMVAGLVAGLLMSIPPVLVALPRRAQLVVASDRTIARSTALWVRGLLVAQVALSMVLVIGAGLLGRSLHKLQQMNPGIDTEGLMMVRVTQVPGGYARIDNAAYYPPLLERVSALPGVRSAALGRAFPRMFTDAGGQSLRVSGEENRDLSAYLEIVSPTYFETLGIRLLDGRVASWADTASSRRVVIVNERLALLVGHGRAVIGKRISLGTDPVHQDAEIVGVVSNATMGNPRSPDLPVFYRPALQVARYANFGSLLIRADEHSIASVGAATRKIVEEAGFEFVPEISTVADVLYRAPATERMSATLATTLGGLAVLLAFIGVFAMLAYGVARRTREIGVRTALGAAPRQLMWLIAREGVLLSVLGVSVGVPLAYVGAQSLGGLLFGIPQFDPATFLTASMFFVGIGLAATMVPARRAAQVDPVVALRTD